MRKMALILALFVSSHAMAGKWNSQGIYENGLDRLQKLQQGGFLNPSVCINEGNFTLALIYSDDFRANKEVYVFDAVGNAQKRARSSVNFNIQPNGEIDGEYFVRWGKLNFQNIVCFESRMQLEGVFN